MPVTFCIPGRTRSDLPLISFSQSWWEIDRISKRLGTGGDTGIAMVSPDYWPLPWYLRDYKRVGYYQQIVATNEPIIVGSMAQEEQLKQTYGDRYVLMSSGKGDGSFGLRPGVDLLLYVRKDVAK
jgi:hypothetical protein